MRQTRYIEIKPRQGNIFAQIAALIVGLGVLVVSVILGAFFLAAFFGFALLVGLTLYLRFWWARRRFQQEQRDEFIEAEYRVVDKNERDPREP